MAITLGNGTITGLNEGGLPDNTISLDDLYPGTMKYQWLYNNKGTLLTGVRDSGNSSSRSFNINSYINGVTYDTRAIVLRVRYVHGGGANHGYWNFTAYQSGNSNYAYSANAHYDWYYNTDNYHLYVPWDPAGSSTIVIDNQSSYNNGSANYYNLYVEGYVRGGI